MGTDIQDGRIIKNMQVSCTIKIVQKQHQKTSTLTKGIIKEILTKSYNHLHGIKVLLNTGEVGHVNGILL